MTIQDMLSAGVPSNAELQIMALDWNPKVPLTLAGVIDATTGNPIGIKSPLLVFFAGPNSFKSFDNTGYNFPPQYNFS